MTQVSLIIVNYNHPEIIEKCLRSIKITEGVDYEVVVVDNGSEPDVIPKLYGFKDEKLIDTLVLSPTNEMFSGGNNLGVEHSDPTSEYLVLVNSDVAFIRPDWLTKQLAWIEGTAEYWPSVWDFHPTQVRPGPLDVVSFGWSHDGAVEPSHCRPEGFCCMFRRSVWRDMSTDFPFYYGFEEMVASIGREGHRIGCCWNYSTYFIHAEQGSGGAKMAPHVHNKRTPDIPGWFRGVEIETLDFTLGPNEHQSYLCW